MISDSLPDIFVPSADLNFSFRLSMVVGGGVLQSGGQTKFMTLINIIGPWAFGVPAGFLAAYCFKLPIWWVYLILSLEEYVRLIISVWLLKSKRWMKNVAV